MGCFERGLLRLFVSVDRFPGRFPGRFLDRLVLLLLLRKKTQFHRRGRAATFYLQGGNMYNE